MTQLSLKIINCPNCGMENRIVYYASINTTFDFDGSQIAKLLDGTLNTSKCQNCGVLIRLSLDVLINCPNCMFHLNPADTFENKKKQLETYGVLSNEGKIISGLESWFSKVKNEVEFKKEYKPTPLPPPAPKITSFTKIFNERIEELSKKLSKNKKDEKDNQFKNNTKEFDSHTPTPPSPPPPPPPSES
jgi:hypothetical protein